MADTYAGGSVMTISHFLCTISELLANHNVDPTSEVVIGLYDEDGHIRDLDLESIDYMYDSADDDKKPNWARKKLIEIKVY